MNTTITSTFTTNPDIYASNIKISNSDIITWNDSSLISEVISDIMKKENKKNAKIAIKETIKHIKKIIFKNPATVIIWDNEEKTVVKCQNEEPFDEEKGLAMALLKHFFDNSPRYNDFFTKCKDKIERL